MESQIYGTPVIGANIGGIPELIQQGRTGELFQSGNIEQLKNVIIKLLGNERILKEYTQNCSNIHFYSSDEYYNMLMKLYD
jgi:glycosyltransferase involved in cell wall biosynthesis